MMLLNYTLLFKCADLCPEHNNTVEYKPQPQHLAAPTGMLFYLEPFRHMAAKWRRAPTKKVGVACQSTADSAHAIRSVTWLVFCSKIYLT